MDIFECVYNKYPNGFLLTPHPSISASICHLHAEKKTQKRSHSQIHTDTDFSVTIRTVITALQTIKH